MSANPQRLEGINWPALIEPMDIAAYELEPGHWLLIKSHTTGMKPELYPRAAVSARRVLDVLVSRGTRRVEVVLGNDPQDRLVADCEEIVVVLAGPIPEGPPAGRPISDRPQA